MRVTGNTMDTSTTLIRKLWQYLQRPCAMTDCPIRTTSNS